MCLWFKRKPDIESSFDPRVGTSTITAPISGAYVDPVDPPRTILAGAAATQTNNETPLTSHWPMSMSSPFECSQQQIHPALRKDSASKASPRIPTTPSESPKHSSQSASSQRLSTGTEFSYLTSQSPPRSPQLSPSHEKRSPSIHATNRQFLPRNPKQNLPASDQSSRATSPSPIPVHQAYIPTNQLSIGSKLANGSNSDTPTTAGPQTANSFGSRNGSTAVSPIEGWNPFGKRESDGSSTQVVASNGKTLGAISGGKSKEKEQKEGDRVKIVQAQPAPVTPPWEQRHIPVMVVPQPQQAELAREVGDENGLGMAPDRRARPSKSFLPHIKLGNVPMRRPRMPQTPGSPSPEEEHWPGNF